MSGAIPGNVHDTGQPLHVKNNIKSRVKLSNTETNFQPQNNNAICKKNLNEHLVLKPEDIVNNICQTIKNTADACKLPTRSFYLLCQRLYKDALEAHLFAKQKKYQAKYTSSGDQIDIKQTIKKAKKYKNELNSLRDTLYSGNVIDICLNLAPLFIDAARSGHLNSAFIENLYNQIEQMVPSDSQVPGYLRILQISFARFLHPKTLQAFINYINTYLQQIQAAQDRAAQNEIEEKLLLFVYNVLVPPYQRPYSGSCFLSAILINMWHNNPVKLMNLIKCVINLNGTIDLTFMHGKGAFDPRDFKKRCDKRDAIYEILSAVLASTDEYEQISVVIDEETQDNPLKYQTELILKKRKIPDQIAAYIADTITDKVFYENGRRIPLCAHKKYNEKTIDVMHNIAHELTKAMSRVGYKNPDDVTLNLMAIDILSNVHARGGIPENIMKNLSKKPRPPRVETIEYKTPILNDTFSLDELRPILNVLQYGQQVIDENSEPLPIDKMIITSITYAKGGTSDGHAFNFYAGDYENFLQTIPVGGIIAIGHANYPDSKVQDSQIYVEKVGPDEFRVTIDGRPFLHNMIMIQFWPFF